MFWRLGLLFGYSAICFSKFLSEDGHIDTIEKDEERGREAIANVKDMGLEDKIKVFIR